jgi:hypothetical protein
MLHSICINKINPFNLEIRLNNAEIASYYRTENTLYFHSKD